VLGGESEGGGGGAGGGGRVGNAWGRWARFIWGGRWWWVGGGAGGEAGVLPLVWAE